MIKVCYMSFSLTSSFLDETGRIHRYKVVNVIQFARTLLSLSSSLSPLPPSLSFHCGGGTGAEEWCVSSGRGALGSWSVGVVLEWAVGGWPGGRGGEV